MRRVVGGIDDVAAVFVHAVVNYTLQDGGKDDRVPVSEFLG